jgi:hypothetical protein
MLSLIFGGDKSTNVTKRRTTMDVFQKAGEAVASVEKEVAKGVAFVSHLYDEVGSKLAIFAKDEPQLASAVTDLVEKGEVFLATSVPAITDKGLDLPADSAAFAALQAFVKSFESAAGTLKQIIAAAK